MVIDKIINESGVVMLADFNYDFQTNRYTYTGRNTLFYYSKKYIIDGEEFVLGSKNEGSKPNALVHSLTGAWAINEGELKNLTDSAILSNLIVKRSRTKYSTLHDVVVAFQNDSSGYKFELCQISLLMQ